MKAGLVQLSVSDDPARNLPVTISFIREAAGNGAGFVLTPECTNLLSSDRAYQNEVLCFEEDDPTLAALRAEADELGIWLLIGSIGLKTHDADGRFANRSFLIGPKGQIAARYDKIHMFDVDVSATEKYRESEGYRPGTRAVVADAGFAKLGMAICYDLRFPYLFRALAKGGAQILTLPAAFNDTTGAAHWESLIRARAIENTLYVAGADHPPPLGVGASAVVDPQGVEIAGVGTATDVAVGFVDAAIIERVRRVNPALALRRFRVEPIPRTGDPGAH